MVPSSTVPPYSSSSFSTRIVPSVSPPDANTAASPTLGVPSGSEGRSGSLPPVGPRKHDLSYDIALSPDSTASPPATGPYIGPDGSLTTGEDHRAKRRKNGPGSRGVANLTPEQLAKKRANDREAQRAVRERTKHQIEQLENRIRELTSLQPYQELQAVIRAKEAVEAENAEIKNRLASIMALIQPVLSGHQGAGVGEQTSAAPRPMHNTLPVHPAPPPSVLSAVSPANNPSPDASTTAPSTTAASPTTVDTPPYSSGRNLNAPPQPPLSPRLSHVKVVGQRRQDLLHNLDLGAGEQLQLNFLLDPSQRVNKFQNGLHESRDSSPACQHLLMKQEWSGASFPVSPTQGGPGMGDRSQHHQQPDVNPASGLPAHRESWVTYSAPIKNCSPTSTLDNLLLAFIHERRQRAAEGIPTQEVVGPRYPSVSSLLNPATNAYVHPMSKVFADILTTFPGLCTLPERVAVLYYMFLNMRWWINPSQENFDLLPRWARPVPAQQSTPHPAWIDHVPFPRMREKLVREYNPSEYLFDDFFIPYTGTLSVNWPYEPEDALLQTADSSELLINPVFERHLRRLQNWTLGEAFDRAYPQLRGTYNLKMTMKTKTTAAEVTGTGTTTAGTGRSASTSSNHNNNNNNNHNNNSHSHNHNNNNKGKSTATTPLS